MGKAGCRERRPPSSVSELYDRIRSGDAAAFCELQDRILDVLVRRTRRVATKLVPRLALLIGVVVVCLQGHVAGEPQRVVDMRFPGPGIVTTAMDVPIGVYPRFAGDIDGDGRDDFLVSERISEPGVLDVIADLLLVYGTTAEGLESSVLSPQHLRHTRFRGSPGLTLAGSDDPYAGVGDWNGDGYGDFLLGISHASWDGIKWTGLVLLIWGAPDLPDEISLEDLVVSADRAVRWIPRTERLSFGRVVVPAGDLDGDGWMDVAISARSAGTEDGVSGAGKIYMVFGGPGVCQDIEAEEIGSGVRGSVLFGAHGGPHWSDLLGCNGGLVAPAGDLNGDGLSDLAATAEGVQDGRGAVYIVLGSQEMPDELLAARPGGPLVEIVGGMAERLSGVAGAGDVDGDGYGDLLVGAPGRDRCYLIYGTGELPVSSELTGGALRVTRFHVTSVAYFETGLSSVAGIPDQNGDGFDEILLGGPGLGVRAGSHHGKAFWIPGGPWLGPDVYVDDVGTAALPGTVYLGATSQGNFGGSADAAGDFDGDGTSDILVTAPVFVPPDWPRGDSYLYVIFGGRGDGHRLSVEGLLGDSGSVDGGYEVRVMGTGFEGGERVWFGDKEAPSAEVLSSAEIRVVVPARPEEGAVDVHVEGPGGSASLEDGFRYVARPWIPDVMLDPEWLEAHGYRSMVYTDTLWPPEGAQCMNCFSGDVNGDGVDDLVIGAPIGTPDRWSRVSLIFGRRGGLPPEIGPGDSGRYGTLIDGGPGLGNLASFVALPGDLDGDGQYDLALGRCVVFGREEWPEQLLVAEEMSTGGAVELPSRGSSLPMVAGPGDPTGEGTPSLLASYAGLGAAGRVLVFPWGILPSSGGEPQLAEIFGDPSVIVRPKVPHLDGESPREFGTELSAAGDVNGDGLLDFVVGANHSLCAFYLVLGGSYDFLFAGIDEFVEVGRGVLVHYNEQPGAFCGRSGTACALGDFNGDGFDDVALGAPGGGLDHEGAVHVLLGAEDLGTEVRELSLVSAGPERAIRLVGEDPYSWAGHPESLGDLNGDGYPDLGITGEFHRTTPDRAYVVYGGPDLPGEIELGSVGRLGLGYRIVAKEDYWFSGHNGGIAGGDFDGDGVGDVVIGEAAPTEDERRRQAVVIFGRREEARKFLRGDSDGDGVVLITDAIYLLAHLFQGATAPWCLDAADCDDSGDLGITDAIYLLQHLFLGGPALPQPYPERGVDPTADALGC